MSQTSLTSFAIRLVNSNIEPSVIENGTGTGEEERNMHAHVLGIFVSLDTDKDGLITRPQLLQGIMLLGLRPTETLLRKFQGEVAEVPARRSSVLMSVDERVRQSKIDPKTFSKVVMEEWMRVRHTLKSSLDPLFSFAVEGQAAVNRIAHGGMSGKGVNEDAATITPTALKHLMQGIQVSTKLSDKDYASFLELLPTDALGNVTMRDLKRVLFE
jgi:hypothetical protein